MVFVTVDNTFAFDIEETGDEDSMIAYAKELALETLARLPDSDFILNVEMEE